MTNHVHIVAIPEHPDSLSRLFHFAHGVYATRFNIKHGLTGHLWQARPFSSCLDDFHRCRASTPTSSRSEKTRAQTTATPPWAAPLNLAWWWKRTITTRLCFMILNSVSVPRIHMPGRRTEPWKSPKGILGTDTELSLACRNARRKN